jgi:hypothetical protein
MVGLFQKAPGASRNIPIVRHGNLAMIPKDRLKTMYGEAEVYLIEARSIGGLSGSPAFIRQTIDLEITKNDGAKSRMSGLSEVFCLGIVHGHWDIGVNEINSILVDSNARTPGVNMGIGIVTPAKKLLETLNHPEILEAMKTVEDQHPQNGSTQA